MSQAPRLIFAGTPDFAVPPLEALVERGRPPVAVYTQPDRPAGRGRRPRPSPVKQAARAHGIPVYQPESLRHPEAVRELAALAPDLMVVVAYGQILPREVLDLPSRGCINIHASLLPRWRGAAPIQRAMLAGDPETGVCLMRMEAGLDTGPVLARAATPIHPEDTGGTLHDRLAAIGAGLLAENLDAILDGRLEAEPQDERRATYAAKLDKSEAAMDWSLPADRLRRQVTAFNPWPVAEACWRGERLRIWRATTLPEAPPADTVAGTILKADADGIDVACGEGVLRLLELQAAGSRAMSAADFLNGHRLSPGESLAGHRWAE